MTPQTITERLHAKADAELKERLAKLFDAIRTETAHSFPVIIQVASPRASDTPHTQTTSEVYACEIINSLQELAFTVQRDNNRSRVVSEFMDGVERLGSEIDELRGVIEQ